MDPEDNKSVVNQFVEVVWRQGKMDRIAEFWTDDCVNHASGAQQKEGLSALVTYHEQFGTAFAGFSDIDIQIVQQVADITKVVTHMVTQLKHTGAFNGIPATGKTVTLASIRIDRIEDGKIAEHWSVGDLAGLMQQLQS